MRECEIQSSVETTLASRFNLLLPLSQKKLSFNSQLSNQANLNGLPRSGLVQYSLCSEKHNEYFHVVFTLPDELGALALQNKAVIYNLLFKATSQTLLEAAAGWKDLKAKIGFFAILHTWGSQLNLNPHS